jgi:hypothetical protein
MTAAFCKIINGSQTINSEANSNPLILPRRTSPYKGLPSHKLLLDMLDEEALPVQKEPSYSSFNLSVQKETKHAFRIPEQNTNQLITNSTTNLKDSKVWEDFNICEGIDEQVSANKTLISKRP